MFKKRKLIKLYKKHRFKKINKKNKQKKIFKTILLFLLAINNFGYDYINNITFMNQPDLKIFIMAHKDFDNYRYNPIYTIVADDKSQLQKKYNLKVMYANDGKLYPLNRAYSELSQLYYIYQLYKKGEISSKYIGLNHYRRYFNFTDNIPDMDDIFKNYDVILNDQFNDSIGMKSQYCRMHFCINYNEILDIIRDIKPDYYEIALQTNNLKHIHCCNLFIMKKEDFFKYCEFMYDILFEFDRRHNFKTDDDVLNYVKRLGSGEYHSRIQAFLSERIGNIFYQKNFKRVKIFDYGLFNYTEKTNKASLFRKNFFDGNKSRIIIFILLIINQILLLAILFTFFSKTLILK